MKKLVFGLLIIASIFCVACDFETPAIEYVSHKNVHSDVTIIMNDNGTYTAKQDNFEYTIETTEYAVNGKDKHSYSVDKETFEKYAVGDKW